MEARSKHLNTKQAVLAVIAFRHFIRVSTWKYLKRCFRPGHAEPHWKVLEQDLRGTDEALHKAFSRPVTVYDDMGEYLGEDSISNAVLTLRRMWKHEALDRIASAMKGNIETVSQYEECFLAYDELQAAFPGALGTYRRSQKFDSGLPWGQIRSRKHRGISTYFFGIKRVS